jgi:hypothetical protein
MWRLIRRLVAFIFIVFLLPAALTVAWWRVQERPPSWRAADWSSSALLPRASADDAAAVYVLAARTGGLKGAFAVHSWIVTKDAGADAYMRYDKVGWGSPVRTNAYAADGRWYSNPPEIVCEAHGPDAEALIPAMEAAVASYPFSDRGDYRAWPGPNSNSFVAHVVRAVPALGSCLLPNATGRDYAPGLVAVDVSPESWDVHVTFGGVAGFSAGLASGIELHFMGLVAGIDIRNPALKIPAFGRVGLPH